MKKPIAVLLALSALVFATVSSAEEISAADCEPGLWCTVTNQAELDANLNHAPVTVIAFDSVTCGYCKFVAPTVEKLAMEYKGRVQFLKVDMRNAYNFERYAFVVPGTPTYYAFQDGRKMDKRVGVMGLAGGMNAAREANVIKQHDLGVALTREEGNTIMLNHVEAVYREWLDSLIQ
jgi:thiol-disulfide isomerase/thioredoxin